MQVSARPVLFAVALLLLPLSVVRSAGQAPGAARKSITIDVVVDAKDAKTSDVAGLQQSDFSLFDNKVPRTITSFRAIGAAQEPVRVVVLIDAVNIRFNGLAYERDQVSRFLRAHDGHLAHPTAIAILTDKGLQVQDEFSTDGNAMSDDLQKQNVGLRTLRDDAGVYGAEDRLGISINGLRLLATRAAAQPGRTIILWVSPGWPMLSGPAMQLSEKEQKQIFGNVVSLSTQLREARVTLYALDPIGSNEGVGRETYYRDFLKGVIKPSKVDPGNLSLQVLAVQSGGVALNSNDTTGMLEKSVAELDNYYEISFEPPPAEARDTYHHLEIKLDKPGLTARTRDGYYAQP